METAVVVEILAAEPAVAEHRRRLDVAASWGVGAHVSVLYPFVDLSAIGDEVLRRLGAAIRSVSAFDCAFRRCAWFDQDVVWLAPDPSRPFRDLTAAVWAQFPQFPPYGGEFDDVVPHLTLGERSRGTLEELRTAAAEVDAALPITTYVDRAALIAGRPEPDSWRTVHEFPLRSR